MRIALDYDGTVTLDVKSWMSFVQTFKSAGHDVRIVTMRYQSEIVNMAPEIVENMSIIFTARQSKLKVCQELGWIPHVWIDDNPRAVNESASQIWGVTYPEGHVDTSNVIKD